MRKVLAGIADAALRIWQQRGKQQNQKQQRGRQRHTPTPQHHQDYPEPGITVAYPGDFTGLLAVDYQPEKDGDVDPGEVVWSWVPFEEDHSKGKDRPVLVVGRDHDWLLGLPLSSKNHQLDRDQEAAEGRFWVGIGHGPWDAGNHTSSVRVNRVIRVAPSSVRRIGGQLSKQHFADVLDGLEAHYSGGVTGRVH